MPVRNLRIVERYLYRGVNPDIHARNGGDLVPKALGKPFQSHAYYGVTCWNDGSVYGESERNAVIQHQTDSSKHATSGISTTPIYENAVRYATHDGKYASGYVYKIDATLLETYEVNSYVVEEHATQPAIPGDKEIILVAKDFGVIPNGVVVEVIEI
jgi:hypothetical protein